MAVVGARPAPPRVEHGAADGVSAATDPGGHDAAPVIAIDGPAASGKGTIAARVAQALGFHLLDSGALYRLVALKAQGEGVAFDDAPRLGALATVLDVAFAGETVTLDGTDVTATIRKEAIAEGASRVAVHPAVRGALLARQRAFRLPPGLVADGRDMGTVVFPKACVKVFVTATPEIRAERRRQQFAARGATLDASVALAEIRARDERDSTRAAAPLKAASDAVVLDTSVLSIDAAVAFVLDRYARRAH